MINHIRKQVGSRRIVAIGNPPYQEADGGAKASAQPIYNYFVEALIDNSDINEFSLVIPARWFAAGKGLDSFRSKIMNGKNVSTIRYFGRSEDVFPTVHVQGGVCFLNWKSEIQKKTVFTDDISSYDVDLNTFDIIPDDPKAYPIIEKIKKSQCKQFISDVAWSRKPFGLPTNYFQINEEADNNHSDAIKCYLKGRKTKYILRSEIVVNADKIDLWKVAIPRAYATGARRCTLPKHQFFIIEKGAVVTETYNIISAFKTKQEAELLISYLQTDFARYLLGVRKLTQDIPKDRWLWVPYVDTCKKWTDEKLFAEFCITKSEQEHIRAKVKEWSC